MAVYINGIIATKQDLATLERRLRLHMERARGIIYKKQIHYKTK